MICAVSLIAGFLSSRWLCLWLPRSEPSLSAMGCAGTSACLHLGPAGVSLSSAQPYTGADSKVPKGLCCTASVRLCHLDLSSTLSLGQSRDIIYSMLLPILPTTLLPVSPSGNTSGSSLPFYLPLGLGMIQVSIHFSLQNSHSFIAHVFLPRSSVGAQRAQVG